MEAWSQDTILGQTVEDSQTFATTKKPQMSVHSARGARRIESRIQGSPEQLEISPCALAVRGLSHM